MRRLAFVFTPTISLILLLLGNGFLGTLIGVRLELSGYSSWVLGEVTSAYYIGLMLGSFRSEQFIIRVGHIRAYATFAAIYGVTILAMGMYLTPWAWIALRFANGFAMAGLFIVIESWFLASGPDKARGKLLAWYKTALYGAQAAGQFMMHLVDPMSIEPFCLMTICTSLSIIPISMTYLASPMIERPSALNLKSLYHISPAAVMGSLVGGMVLSVIFGMYPQYIIKQGYLAQDVALVMGLLIIGGAVFQYPIGRISDNFDRRYVLAFVSLINVLLCLLILLFSSKAQSLLNYSSFLLGAVTFLIYPLSIATACDQIDESDIVAVTQGLLLAYGLGAAIGPLIAPGWIYIFGASGLLLFIMSIIGLLGGFLYWRGMVRPIFKQQGKSFVGLPQTTPHAKKLDPRSQSKEGEHE